MLILYKPGNSRDNSVASVAVVFGVGLIGTYLVRNLYKYEYKTAQILPFSWYNQSFREKEKQDIFDCIRNFVMQGRDHGDSLCKGGPYALSPWAEINLALGKVDFSKNNQNSNRLPKSTSDEANNNERSCCRIDFVWSAGKGGFGMEDRDTHHELNMFSEVLKLAITVGRDNPHCLLRFHMISSAGGLFEGQQNVSDDSRPDPRRPYAFLKLTQEKILEHCDDLVWLIYRPTSVYGFAGLNRRLGLIPTLLWNGSQNKVCTIFGAPETLRDYVWADDVGGFIAGRVQSGATNSGRFTLASAKPSALFEVLNYIEKILNKKLFRHYIKNSDNTAHNTFSMRTHPVGWEPLNLETGIRKTFQAMFSPFSIITNVFL